MRILFLFIAGDQLVAQVEYGFHLDEVIYLCTMYNMKIREACYLQ